MTEQGDLTFQQLRSANLSRCPQFQNSLGEVAHLEGLESWHPAQWFLAFVGEVGEAANLIKKVDRGDFTLDQKRHDLPPNVVPGAMRVRVG